MATETDTIRERSSSALFGLTWEDHYKPVVKYVTLTFFMVWMLLPVYYTFVQSIRVPAQIFTEPMGIPFITFQVPAWSKLAWNTMWVNFPFVEYLLATIVVSVGTASLATVVAVFAAYAFARVDFPAKNTLFVLSVAGFMFPIVLITIPVFVMMNTLSLVNTYLGMILAFTSFTIPYNIWLLRGFFEDLPENLEESARVDGATQVGAFFRVILPLSRPAIASVFLLAFLLAWHMFVMALVLSGDPLHKTLPVGILQLKSTFFVQNFHYIMAGTFLTLIVPILMYMYLQKYLVEGLSAGSGVKG
ncbi:MAG: carbohydrate ABC transporter permease [Halodesulfurarchaeum sp.]